MGKSTFAEADYFVVLELINDGRLSGQQVHGDYIFDSDILNDG